LPSTRGARHGTRQTGEDVHQRRRAVLTEESVHLAGAQIEID
jgi:hypothetical protein